MLTDQMALIQRSIVENNQDCVNKIHSSLESAKISLREEWKIGKMEGNIAPRNQAD